MVAGRSWVVMVWCFFLVSFWPTVRRLTTRGHERLRRSGRGRSCISVRTSAVPWARCEGGKSRLVVDLAADHADGAEEGDAVGVVAEVFSGLGHEHPDSVVGEQVRPYLLFHQLRGTRP